MVRGAIVSLVVDPAILLAIFLPGYATFYLLLSLSRALSWPWLWDPSVVVAGVVGGAASYPFHSSLSAVSRGEVLGVVWVAYRSSSTGVAVACTCAMILLWAEGSGRVEPPKPLAPIGERMRGRQYE